MSVCIKDATVCLPAILVGGREALGVEELIDQTPHIFFSEPGSACNLLDLTAFNTIRTYNRYNERPMSAH
jgi:hypothetical protein